MEITHFIQNLRSFCLFLLYIIIILIFSEDGVKVGFYPGSILKDVTTGDELYVPHNEHNFNVEHKGSYLVLTNADSK